MKIWWHILEGSCHPDWGWHWKTNRKVIDSSCLSFAANYETKHSCWQNDQHHSYRWSQGGTILCRNTPESSCSWSLYHPLVFDTGAEIHHRTGNDPTSSIMTGHRVKDNVSDVEATVTCWTCHPCQNVPHLTHGWKRPHCILTVSWDYRRYLNAVKTSVYNVNSGHSFWLLKVNCVYIFLGSKILIV